MSALVFGWKNRPAEVRRVLRSLPFPRYDLSAINLTGSGVGKTVLLSDIAKQVTGGHLPAQDQPRGTCVSRGWSRAIDYLQCVQIAGGKSDKYQSISHSVVYGMAKEYGQDLSYEDGAVGAWAAFVVSTWGNCTNEEAKDRDAGYDDLAVEWGAHKVPDALKALALDNPVKTVTLVSKPEQARDMICNGYPVSVCSGQGFTMTRDSDGHCDAQGSWAHCMMWSGYRDDKKQFLVEQSWGQKTPDGPLGSLDIPTNAFWIDWSVGAGMLAEEDSFALSSFVGYPNQDLLSWLI